LSCCMWGTLAAADVVGGATGLWNLVAVREKHQNPS
jgi:hypothetical protein